jgi:LexA DNA binding domain
MRTKRNQSEAVTGQLRGCQVSHVSIVDGQHLLMHFTNGLVLVVEGGERGLTVSVDSPRRRIHPDGEHVRPTPRQLEYLRFIARYILRFGRAPAESDIQRHCLVSAPSVNQMMQTLERLGFISRQRGVPRSIRVNITLPAVMETIPDSTVSEHRTTVNVRAEQGPDQRTRPRRRSLELAVS